MQRSVNKISLGRERVGMGWEDVMMGKINMVFNSATF